jgi:hypothetical protein
MHHVLHIPLLLIGPYIILNILLAKTGAYFYPLRGANLAFPYVSVLYRFYVTYI